MFSNERPSPFERQPYAQPRPPVPEDMLKSERLQIERKLFILTLKENPRGRFLRIAEDAGSHRNMIIVPASGLEEFSKMLGEMLKASSDAIPLKKALLD